MAHVSGNPTWTNTAATPINAAALENLEANGDYAVPTVQGMWLPSYQSLLAWSCDPGMATGAVNFANGYMFTAAIPVGGTMSVSGIACVVTTANASLTAGQNFMGLYDPNGNLIASTASQATNWAATGAKQMPLVGGPYAVTAGVYNVWGLINLTSASLYFGAMSGSTAALNLNRFQPRGGYVPSTGNTVLPATAPTSVNQLNLPWLAIY